MGWKACSQELLHVKGKIHLPVHIWKLCCECAKYWAKQKVQQKTPCVCMLGIHNMLHVQEPESVLNQPDYANKKLSPPDEVR